MVNSSWLEILKETLIEKKTIGSVDIDILDECIEKLKATEELENQVNMDIDLFIKAVDLKGILENDKKAKALDIIREKCFVVTKSKLQKDENDLLDEVLKDEE